MFGLLAGVAFVACTNDDDPAGASPVNGGNKVATAPKYMTVNFVMPGGAATRADGDLVPANFDESLINNAQFLFFKGENQVAAPFKITSGDGKDTAENNTSEADDDAVKGNGPFANQKDFGWDGKEAVVVMDNPTAIPTSLVVLINYNQDIAKETTLTQLKAIGSDFSNVDKGIVMSNAVYNDAAGNNIIGTPVDPANICETPDAARANPVQVNVDRVLAKVQVKNSVAENAATGVDKVTVTLDHW